MAAWLLNQNPRPCDQYPKKLNSQKAVNCRQLSNNQRLSVAIQRGNSASVMGTMNGDDEEFFFV